VEAIRRIGKVSAVAAKAAIESLMAKFLSLFNENHLRLMIDNDWYIIESIQWSMRHRPDYRGVPPDQARWFEARRLYFVKMGFAALGFARSIALMFPRHVVEKYLNAEYALKYFDKNIPWVSKVIREKGDRGRRWLEKQVKEIKDFLYQSPNRRVPPSTLRPTRGRGFRHYPPRG